MAAFMNTLVSRRSDLLQAIGQHLSISMIALLIAMLIAMPLAYWTQSRPKTANIILQAASVLQTIPSLALLGLLIPFVGIGTVPAVIALVVYAVLPIYQNTYLGLHNIDPDLDEAADAFGMSRTRKLIKVQLPLAASTILGGIRTALVMIIGTATLAALIGAGGLGSFILLGIDRNDTSLILIGAISSAALALILSGLVSWLSHHHWQWTASLVALLVIGGGGTALYGQMNHDETITIAGKMGSEPDILINMYKDLIEQDDPHIHVQLKENFGKTSFLFSALKNGSIDIYPEFSGTVLESLVKLPAGQLRTHRTAAQTSSQATRLLQEQDQMRLLQPMRYDNTYALAVTKSFAKANHLRTISDLARVQDKLHGGFTLEFIDRQDGLKGIKKTYGLTIPNRSFEPALRYTAIHNGKVNIVDAYSTDSELRQYNLQVLRDDKQMFPSYRGAPLMKDDFAKKHPQIVRSLNKLAGHITSSEMSEMNYEVNVKQESTAKVARNYLEKHGLLRKGAR
ncbi:ABC transporter permease/substrate-binding protein [Lacticaseibacillus zhaodongensis]|uniref:ABC transporter permease/substrate-binding protein n=1 Tax=Lacticaseibacillus zhaodongensis TaxID=2668065 RepID=UPI0012D2B177|nr:ABC transporter permease/substrate-binding protein [Lacticaseibacillus zhaodongensis]